jgi:hypothetical protein
MFLFFFIFILFFLCLKCFSTLFYCCYSYKYFFFLSLLFLSIESMILNIAVKYTKLSCVQSNKILNKSTENIIKLEKK